MKFIQTRDILIAVLSMSAVLLVLRASEPKAEGAEGRPAEELERALSLERNSQGRGAEESASLARMLSRVEARLERLEGGLAAEQGRAAAGGEPKEVAPEVRERSERALESASALLAEATGEGVWSIASGAEARQHIASMSPEHLDALRKDLMREINLGGMKIERGAFLP